MRFGGRAGSIRFRHRPAPAAGSRASQTGHPQAASTAGAKPSISESERAPMHDSGAARDRRRKEAGEHSARAEECSIRRSTAAISSKRLFRFSPQHERRRGNRAVQAKASAHGDVLMRTEPARVNDPRSRRRATRQTRARDRRRCDEYRSGASPPPDRSAAAKLARGFARCSAPSRWISLPAPPHPASTLGRREWEHQRRRSGDDVVEYDHFGVAENRT
jgi:hypothetical protein